MKKECLSFSPMTCARHMAHSSHSTSQLHIATTFHFFNVNGLVSECLSTSMDSAISESLVTLRKKEYRYDNLRTMLHLASSLIFTVKIYTDILICIVLLCNMSDTHCFHSAKSGKIMKDAKDLHIVESITVC